MLSIWLERTPEATPADATDSAKLKLLRLEGGQTQEDIAQMGRRIVTESFALQDFAHNPRAFCRTVDGKWVFFRSTPDKLLGRKNPEGIRSPEETRIRRLHWIIPILTGKTTETVLMRDIQGKDIDEWHPPNTTYRIYWLPKRKYVVVLSHRRGRKRKITLSLVSAYLVTDPPTRKNLERLFPKK